MAGIYEKLAEQPFSDTDTIIFNHGQNRTLGLNVRIVVDGVSRPDLIRNVEPDPTQPNDKFIVTLSSVQTGVIQLLAKDNHCSNELTSEDLLKVKSGDLPASVVLKDNGVPVPNTPHKQLNFADGITVDDNGDGSADISGITIDVFKAVQVRRSTAFNNVGTSWVDIEFDETDIESDSSVLEHNNSDTEKIDVKADGLYLLFSNIAFDDRMSFRFYKNGDTLINGFYNSAIGSSGGEGDFDLPFNPIVLTNLSAGDYITLQADGSGSSDDIQENCTFGIIKLEGIKGEKGTNGLDGAPGSGSTIIVKDNDVNLPNTPHDKLNFLGMLLSDAGGGKANIQNKFGSNFHPFASLPLQTDTDTDWVQKASFSTSVLPAGDYIVFFTFQWYLTATNDVDCDVQIERNDSVQDYWFRNESKDSGTDQRRSVTDFYVLTGISGIQKFDIDFKRNGSSGTVGIRNVKLVLWRVN